MVVNQDLGHLERSREKLKKDVNKRIMKSVEDILSVAEVAIADPQRYKLFRAKVLKASNDAVRELKTTLDRDYRVEFVSSREDVVQVQAPRLNRA